MAAVNAQLVSRSEGLVQLFTPPFDRTPHDPGYIKAYPPGLRENGGQYTHAAMWVTLAFALLGDGDRAGGAVLADQSGESLEHARRDSPLQGRALRGVRGRVLGARAHRPRRLDLVHGFGRLDVSHRRRRHARASACEGADAAHRPLHAAQLAGLRGHLQARLVALSHRGGESARRCAAASSGRRSTARYRASHPATSRSRTMARITTRESRWAEAFTGLGALFGRSASVSLERDDHAHHRARRQQSNQPPRQRAAAPGASRAAVAPTAPSPSPLMQGAHGAAAGKTARRVLLFLAGLRGRRLQDTLDLRPAFGEPRQDGGSGCIVGGVLHGCALKLPA